MNWEYHPYLPIPTDEQIIAMGADGLREYHTKRAEAIQNERIDPIRYGKVLDQWEEAKALLEDPACDELWIFGGNRSSKSKFAAWLVMMALWNNPGSKIFCWSQNDETSKLNQQPYFWEYMPRELRKKQRGEITKIVYTKANGFTDKNFILPNGSQCIFKTYSQFQNDENTIEGAELGAPLNIDLEWLSMGNWFDEYLIDDSLLETMRPRLATRNCLNLITFTPIGGYTDTVRKILQGAKVLKKRYVDLFDQVQEEVPVVLQPTKENAKCMCFHSDQNPWAGWERLAKDLKGESREKILVRFYGWPTKSATSKFPKFTREHNVVKHEDLPFVRDPNYPVTRYLVIDNAPVKPWSMGWFAVDEDGVHYIYREYPGIEYGEWALWGKNNRSKPGPAAKANGMSVREYVEMITEDESEEEIFERFIDSRAGNTARQGLDNSSTTIDDLAEAGMIVIPASGIDEEQGLQKLTDLMAWDPNKPIDSNNRPRLIVSERCEQHISCLQEYTGTEGRKEAWKDFVDVCRYAATADLDYVDTTKEEISTIGGY